MNLLLMCTAMKLKFFFLREWQAATLSMPPESAKINFVFGKYDLLYCSIDWKVVPRAGLEPARSNEQRILSPLCRPFHHLGFYKMYTLLIRRIGQQCFYKKAPEVGFEPTTNRLTADRSTTELLRNNLFFSDFFIRFIGNLFLSLSKIVVRFG